MGNCVTGLALGEKLGNNALGADVGSCVVGKLEGAALGSELEGADVGVEVG